MIRVTNTPNLAGVTISGDFEDLHALVEAIYQVTVSDFDEDLNKNSRRYLNISLRVLGLAYDVRHAAQGDREIFTEANGLPEWYIEAAEDSGRSLPQANLRYACNVLYPETILVTMALNDLVKFRMRRLAKGRHGFEAPLDKAVVNDRAITVVRLLQSAFAEAIGAVLSKPSLTRWRNIVYDRITEVVSITHPFVDAWNLRYLGMNREARAKKLVTITKRFAEHRSDRENLEYRHAIDEAVEERGWTERDIRFDGLEYPAEIEW
jgi:hypothetical protein